MLLLVAGPGGCVGDGCAGAAPAEGEFPAERRLDRPLRLRLTAAGAEFLADHALAIARGILGGPDGPASGPAVLDLARLDMGELEAADLGEGSIHLRDVSLAFDAADVDLTLLDSPGRFVVRIERLTVSVVGGSIAFGGDPAQVNVACLLGDGLGWDGPDPRAATVTLQASVELFVNEDGELDAIVTVDELTLHEVGILFPLDCDLPECTDGCGECRAACPLLSVSATVADAVVAELQEALADLARQVFGENVAASLAALGARPVDLLLAPGALLDRYLPSAAEASPLRVLLTPSIGGVSVNADPAGLGQDLTFDAGVDAAPHRCVAPVAGEPVHAVGQPPRGEASAAPEHLVVAFAGGLLDEAVWAAYKSGLLCAAITSAEIAALSDGRLALTAGALESLLPGITSLAGSESRLMVTLSPEFTAPDFPLVTVEQDDVGGAAVALRLPDVGLSLHAAVDGRFVRLIGLRATVGIRGAFTAMPGASLHVTVDAIDVRDLAVDYHELLPGRDVSQLAEFLAGALAGGLLGDLSFPIAAPGAVRDLLGVPLDLEVRSIRADGFDKDWVAARLALVDGNQALAGARTAVQAPATTALGVAPRLLVPAEDEATGRVIEYQARVDHLPWTSFRAGAAPDLSGPHWRVPGDHVVRVRARYAGLPSSTDMAGWTGAVRVEAAGGRDRPAGPGETAGPDGGAARGGCSQAPPAFPALLAPLLRRGARARLGGAAALLATGCADDGPGGDGTCKTTSECPAGTACSRGQCRPPPPCAAPEECCPGQLCLGGVCQDPPDCSAEHCAGPAERCEGGWCVRQGCADDGECPGGLACVGGRCVQGVPCDGRCEDGQACHAVTAECRPAPASCAGRACPEGELLHVDDPDGALLGGGCGWDDATCSCVRSPPLRPGDVGRWGAPAWLPVDGGPVGGAARPVAAAYDATYDDLVWLEWTPGTHGGPPAVIETVAGVPDGAPRVAPPDGYRGGVARPGPRTGRHAALVLAPPSGRPAILHRNDTGRTLDVATLDRAGGAWLIETLDDAGDPGEGIDATATPDGGVAAAYVAHPSDGAWELRYAELPPGGASWRAGLTPGSVSAPTPITPAIAAAGDVVAVAYNTGAEVGLLWSAGGGQFRRHVVAQDPSGGGGPVPDLALALSADAGLVAVVWRRPGQARLVAALGPGPRPEDLVVHELFDGAGGAQMRQVGAWPAAAFDAGTGDLLVAFQDPHDGDLWLVRAATPWSADASPAVSADVLATDGALGFHNAILHAGPAGSAFVYTARLGFDAGGRSLAGPTLIPVPEAR